MESQDRTTAKNRGQVGPRPGRAVAQHGAAGQYDQPPRGGAETGRGQLSTDSTKLLAYWRVHYERVELDGRRLFGDRFVSQDFDEFTRDPEGSVKRIYDAMGVEPPQLDYSRVRPAKAPFEADSPKWKELAREVGLPEE